MPENQIKLFSLSFSFVCSNNVYKYLTSGTVQVLYLSDEIPAADFGFEKFYRLSVVHFYYYFFLISSVWQCPQQIFPSSCDFFPKRSDSVWI